MNKKENALLRQRGTCILFTAALMVGCGASNTPQQGSLPPSQPAASPLVAWGDSLTAGGEGITDTGAYPTDLATLISQTVVNQGVGGNTSTQIGVREGAIPTNATVAGSVIPASGGVAVTFPTGYEPVTNQGPQAGTPGTLLGVHGTVTYTPSAYIFTRDASGSSIAAMAPSPFVVDTPYASYFPVFWEGRNNFPDASQVESDLAAQTAGVKTASYIVMGVINMNVPWEWKGNPGYSAITTLNNSLSSSYGSKYIDIRETLASSYNPALVTDVSDFNHDEPPTSLRAINGTGTLTSAIGPADTVLTITMTTGNLGPGSILTIDTGSNAENVSVASVSGNTATVIRNYGGNDVAHAAGAAVVETDAIHLNAAGYAVVAKAVAARYATL
jgi:lysophospholipase L1-like esterase